MIFGRKIPCGNTNFHRGFCFMNTSDSNFFGTEKVSRILLKIAPPVMLAQLIQALYNIVDSLFVGKYSESGLTALSIIYPLQLLMIAIAVGTGVGINTAMAHYLGVHDEKKQMNMEESEHRLLWCYGHCLRSCVLYACRYMRGCLPIRRR